MMAYNVIPTFCFAIWLNPHVCLISIKHFAYSDSHLHTHEFCCVDVSTLQTKFVQLQVFPKSLVHLGDLIRLSSDNLNTAESTDNNSSETSSSFCCYC